MERKQMRPMTEDYAHLSLMFGFFAAAADRHLGGSDYTALCRSKAWDLTWEMLEELKQEVIAKGIPRELLEPSKEQTEDLESLKVEAGNLQRLVDEQYLKLLS
jgi:hypothetical protein